MSDGGDIPISDFASITGHIFYLKVCQEYGNPISLEDARLLELWDRKVKEYADTQPDIIVPAGG